MEQFEYLKGLLANPGVAYWMGRTHMNKLRESLALMKTHVALMNNNKEPPKCFDADPVVHSTKIFLNMVIERKIEPDIKEFIDKYISLVFSWNENVLKDASIKSTCEYIDRFLKDMLSIQELQDLVIETSKRLRSNLKVNIPSFKTSMHYWGVIKREEEKS